MIFSKCLNLKAKVIELELIIICLLFVLSRTIFTIDEDSELGHSLNLVILGAEHYHEGSYRCRFYDTDEILMARRLAISGSVVVVVIRIKDLTQHAFNLEVKLLPPNP